MRSSSSSREIASARISLSVRLLKFRIVSPFPQQTKPSIAARAARAPKFISDQTTARRQHQSECSLVVIALALEGVRQESNSSGDSSLDFSPGVWKGGASAPPLQGVTNNSSVPLSAQLVATSRAESGTNREGSRDFGGAEAPPFRQPLKVPSRGEQSRLMW